MDKTAYQENLYKRYIEYENMCKRCGSCCGILEGDPCEHLKKDFNKLYFCDIYEERFGLRKTLKGEPILCVPIRNMLHRTWWGRNRCAYVKTTTKTKYIS